MNNSPQATARLAGLLWLLVIVLGTFAQFGVRSSLVVNGDAAATASNILAASTLWRLAFMADVFGAVFYVGAILLLSELLQPAGRTLSRVVAVLVILGGAVASLIHLNHLAALLVLDLLPSGEAEALMRLFLRLHSAGYALSLVLFSGLLLPVLGVLVARSGFFPRPLGWLLTFGGACYLLYTFIFFLAPAFSRQLFPGVAIPFFLAEVSMTLWLLVFGLDASRWKQVRAEGPLPAEAELQPTQ